MGKNELKKLIEKCIVSGSFRVAQGEDCEKDAREELVFLCRHLGILCESELPFYYSKINRELLIVDYVAFDSKQKFARDADIVHSMFFGKRKFERPKPFSEGRYKRLPPVSKGPGTARDYLMNCASAFTKKYAHLDEYKKILKDNGICRPACHIKTCFFIEDVTPLGSYIVSADGMHELVLLYVKQFLDLFEQSAGLDYIFFGCFKGRSDSLWFIGRDDIECYRKKEMDLLKKKYFVFDVDKYGDTI